MPSVLSGVGPHPHAFTRHSARLARCARAALRAAGLAIVVWPASVAAHPAPFSYLDLRITANRIDATLVAHVVDIAHELNVDPAELLAPAVSLRRATAIAEILRQRLSLAVGSEVLPASEWAAPEVLADRQSWRWTFHCDAAKHSGSVQIKAELFPYDSQHQTFVNIYEDGALRSQMILSRGHTTAEYFSSERTGVLSIARKFVPAGIRHILIGPDHLLFLVGLLLLGGTVRRLLIVVTAFTVAHSLTLSLAVLNILTLPSRIVEPAIALSIVYVGVDNLVARHGRDTRVWIAFAFGLIHGFGFASVLREMNLPRHALGWSLASFNIGVELGQIAVVAAVATAVIALRRASVNAGRRLAWAGSLVVIAAGAIWFVQRVWFIGGSL